MKHAACALALTLASLPVLAQTETVPTPTLEAETTPATFGAAPTQVVVEGRRPGPGFWKVSKGDHVMYVFGLYSPLPKKMEWEDAPTERLVRNSQEILLPPNVSLSVSGVGGFFKGLVALPSLIGLEKNPDGAMLQDVLPAKTYERWAALKAKYIGDDASIERLRPIFAAQRLLNAGLERNGLMGNNDIYARIVGIASKHKVKETASGVSKQIDNPRQLLRDFKQSRIEDLACFTKTLDSLEGSIDAIRTRANAWANGNIAEMSQLDFAERDDACDTAVMDSPAVAKTPGFENLMLQARQNWLEAAEKALANNTQTFAMLHMRNILGADSALAALQAKGYTVESPK